MNYLIRTILFLLLIGLVTQACTPTERVPEIPVSELQSSDPDIQELMDSTAAKMRYFPNNIQFAIAIVDGDSTEYVGIYRKDDTLRQISNSDSVFEIGSVTKVMTGILLAEQVVQDSLNMETTLQDLGFDIHNDYQFTLEQLASHTSGMPRIPSNLTFAAAMNRENPYEGYSDDDLRNYLKETVSTNSEPGENYAYSNLGAGVLGFALEEYTGRSYEELLQKDIADPIGMGQTTTLRSKVSDHLVTGRSFNGEPVSNWDMNALMGAGGVLSTPEDMVKFARAQFDTTNKAIQLSQNPRHPVSSGMQIGLGWHIIYRQDGSAWLWHNGGTGGYRSSIYVDEVKQKAVIILTNLSAAHSRSRSIDNLGQDIMEILIRS